MIYVVQTTIGGPKDSFHRELELLRVAASGFLARARGVPGSATSKAPPRPVIDPNDMC